ncbi:MAG: metalloregulator ArsR/SmtB family transcription factor [Desulfobacterales bacterium]|nr:metalloregulator ArsR/SmtB family transcription factor [Desulfobacterales bacterium]MCF8079188.1 metalloregulator ArsR/SmtB family transcription factor [Desulfobacterales bacterium]
MESLVKSLKVLADEKRFRILQLLMAGDLCVGALAAQLGVSTPAVSQHLKILREAGLVKGEKRGYWVHYMVDKKALSQIAEKLQKLVETSEYREIFCWRINEFPANTTQQKEDAMCQNCCQQLDKLKDKPETCAPEQIKECHGDSGGHPCAGEDCPSEKE